MPDDAFRQAKTLTAAGATAAAIVAILCLTPILDARFCFPHTCAPMQTAQNDFPGKGDGCEPCGPVCKEKKKPENAGGVGSATTTTEDHSITIRNINIYGGVGNWCPLPPSGKTAAPDESSSDGTSSNGKSPSDGAATSDEGKENEKGGCIAESSGAKELLGEVYFAHGSPAFDDPAGPSEENTKTLNDVVEEIRCRLRQQSGETILLEAYASYPGTAVYNLNLAGERMQSVIGHIGGEIKRATWTFQQVIYGESHIYRTTGDTSETGETSGQKGNPKNRVVRIFAYNDPCGGMGQEAVGGASCQLPVASSQ